MTPKLYFIALLICSIAGVSGFFLHWNDAVKEERVKTIVESILDMNVGMEKSQLIRIDKHHLLFVKGTKKMTTQSALDRFLKGETKSFIGLDIK